MKRILSALIVLLAIQSMSSQVALKLEGGLGATFGKKGYFDGRHWDLKNGTTLNGNIGLMTEIYVSKSHPFLIETGLSIGGMESAYDHYKGTTDIAFLRLPIKFDYRLQLTERSSITFGLGPALNFELGNVEGREGRFQVGIIPSINYRYRKFSIGISYYNPLFYNGSGNLNKNLLSLNLGLTFNLNPHWGGWSVIGATAGALSDGINAMNYNSYNDSYYLGGDSYENNNTKSAPSRGDGHKIKQEGKEWQRASNQYWDYANRLSEMKSFSERYSKSKREEYQRKMKELRKKYDLKYSEWEDWDGK